MGRVPKRNGGDGTQGPHSSPQSSNASGDSHATGGPFPVLRDWRMRWLSFLDRHKGWWERVNAGESNYALPKEVIDALTQPVQTAHRTKKPLLTDTEAAAE